MIRFCSWKLLKISFKSTNDGFVEFEGDNFDNLSLGFNFGLIYQIAEKTKFGVAYRSEVKMEMEGTADFTVPDRSPPASVMPR